METLKTKLDSLNFSTQIEAAKSLLDKAETRITFWGTRVVEVKGISGYVTLDSLAKRMLKTPFAEIDRLNPEQRVAGIEMTRKLKAFYEITDTQIKNSNFLTRLINWIREFTFNPYTTRFYLEDDFGPEKWFLEYSEAAFVQQFGGTVDDIHKNPAFSASHGENPILRPWRRIEAKEAYVRAQMVRV